MFLMATAFAGVVAAYPFAAKQRGWPTGAFYSTDRAHWLSLGCVAMLIGKLISEWVSRGLGLLWLVWFGLAYIVGSALLYNLAGRASGPISLLAAPLLTLVALLLPLA